ncbi:MAG: metalloregulator ArsR/SmtB family transcription factor [bacterium]
MAQARNPHLPAALAEGCCPSLGELLSTRFFKALCDPNRVGILSQLATAGQPTKVSEVAACCTTDLSVVSRHLKTLLDAGILAAERNGREVRYTVRFGEVARTLRAIADAIEACCPPDQPSCCAVSCTPPSEPATPSEAPASNARRARARSNAKPRTHRAKEKSHD